MGYFSRRAGSHRRGQTSEVDVRNLADIVVRRCRGCEPPERYTQVAEQFLDAIPGKFGEDVQQAVLERVQAGAAKVKGKSQWKLPAAWKPRINGVNGAVVCSQCGERLYDHPMDKQSPWLTVLCDGRKVRVW